jgi:tetratricopeptide (TPR) repeat protein
MRLTISACAAALVLSASAGLAQERNPAVRKAAPKPEIGVRTPELKPLAPAQLFARAFDYFKQGKFSDAEELFLAGLRQDDRDQRAWEWLARSQSALNKDTDAERSLQEAVKRGLPGERAEQARIEMLYPLPVKLPREAEGCFSAKAQQELRTAPVPRSQRSFEVLWESREKAKDGGGPKHSSYRNTYVPVGAGLYRVGDRPENYISYLGLLQYCAAKTIVINELDISGPIFPLRVGNQFRLEASVEGRKDKQTRACKVVDSKPASPEVIANHPTEGEVVTIRCDFTVAHLHIVETYHFYSLLGAFILVPDSAEHSYRITVK